MAFQRFTQSGPHPEVSEEVAARSKNNERVYQRLNDELKHQLILPGEGSVYIARNPDEQISLIHMHNALAKEGRKFPFLSQFEVTSTFGYTPHGVAFGNKTHDRTLSPNFLALLSNRIRENGGRVIEARATTIYTDNPDEGGILEYRTNIDGEKHYIRFEKLVMSLGTQQVYGIDNAPLFDVVSARGVSVVALAYLPMGAKLPPAVVCGGSNHVTKLAGPIQHQGQHLFLLRMTCGACIAPTSDSANYDGVAATGLIKAVGSVLKGRIEVLTVYGCNRQVSQYGQIHWLQVSSTLKSNATGLTPRGNDEDVGSSLPKSPSGIFIQYGAGGGGLTQAPSAPLDSVLVPL